MPFLDIKPANGDPGGIGEPLLPDVKELAVGRGDRAFKIGPDGLWTGGNKFGDHLFGSDHAGNARARSVELSLLRFVPNIPPTGADGEVWADENTAGGKILSAKLGNQATPQQLSASGMVVSSTFSYTGSAVNVVVQYDTWFKPRMIMLNSAFYFGPYGANSEQSYGTATGQANLVGSEAGKCSVVRTGFRNFSFTTVADGVVTIPIINSAEANTVDTYLLRTPESGSPTAAYGANEVEIKVEEWNDEFVKIRYFKLNGNWKLKGNLSIIG